MLVVAGAVLALLVVAGVVVAVVRSSGDDAAGPGGSAGTATSSLVAPAASGGKELTLLDGRLVVAAQAGWEQLDSTPDFATVHVELRNTGGRELLATLVTTALPGGGTLDEALKAEGGVPFEVKSAAGALQGTAVPARGQVLVGALRPRGRFLLTLSVHPIDGKGLDAPTLQKLFSEQIAPTLRFP